VVNLAFSAFTFVSPKPPMLAISVGRKCNLQGRRAEHLNEVCRSSRIRA
jgi:flavin reductase (DIM6/NTAB) family NADH-FMN oxidoreductase RutF